MKNALHRPQSAQLLPRRTLASALAFALTGSCLTAAGYCRAGTDASTDASTYASIQSDVVNLDFARAEFQAGRTMLIDIREPSGYGAHLQRRAGVFWRDEWA